MPRRVGITYHQEGKLEPYAAAARAAGLDPVPISPDKPRSLDGLSALIVSGGPDLDPALYGQPRGPDTQEPVPQRDHLEKELIEQALASRLPLLCICRGMQLFNVAHGGTLIQHTPLALRHQVRPADASEDAHEVRISEGSRLATVLGVRYKQVNSRHHQVVGRLGSGLAVSAASDDGIVEGLERPDLRFALAVQWHPEDRIHRDRLDLRLFSALAEAAG